MITRTHILRHNGLGPLGVRQDGFESYCGVTIIKTGSDTVVAVITELPDNPGTSVTNCFAEIAKKVHSAFMSGVLFKSIIWVEHYPYVPRGEEMGTFDLVTLEECGGRMTPHWRHLGHAGFQQLFGSFDGKERVKIGPFQAIKEMLRAKPPHG